MQIVNKIVIDLQHRKAPPQIDAMQNDALTRAVKVILYDGGTAWVPPTGATVSLAYSKADKTSGWYDKLPDGSNACSVSGNEATAVLAPQVLTAAGTVRAAIIFQDANLNRLATFPFCIQVGADPASGAQSDDYYNYSTMKDVSDAMEEFFEKAEAEQSAFLKAACPAIVCDASGAVIAVADSSDRLVQGLTLYGKTTQDGTPTPDAPVALESVGDSGTINTTVAGKNLLPPSSVSNSLFTADGKGGYTATDASGTIEIGTVALEAGKTYTLSASAKSGVKKPCVIIRKPDGSTNIKTNYANASLPVTYTSPETQTVKILLQTIDANGRCTSGETFYIQLEIGSTATAYELYKEPQTLTASTPNGLPGIPVTSGGNYTDVNGQQWLCDEIDFGRGVYVQRVGRIDSYASETVAEPYLSTTGELSAGATVLYVLAEITETALSPEELTAYAALHTNKPNTTVLNDANADMELAYVADTKLYIDQKLAAISAAVLNK